MGHNECPISQSPAVDKLEEVTDTLDDTWYPDKLEY